MKTRLVFFISLLAIVSSCHNSEIFSKFDKMGEDNRWAQSDVKTYEFTVENDTLTYDLKFHFSHVYDYQFATVPINFEIVNPSGEQERIAIDLAIKNDKGEQLADCSGDLCDLIYTVKTKTHLSKGKYKVLVSNSFNGPYLPNVIGVGIEVEKAEP